MGERTPGDRSAIIDEHIFVEKVGKLVTDFASNGLSLGKTRLGEIFAQLLTLACRHRVRLDTNSVSAVLSICVVEGVGLQLHPEVDLIKAALPHLALAAAGFGAAGMAK